MLITFEYSSRSVEEEAPFNLLQDHFPAITHGRRANRAESFLVYRFIDCHCLHFNISLWTSSHAMPVELIGSRKRFDMLLGHNIQHKHSQHDAQTRLRASKPVPASECRVRAINMTAITLPAMNESETSEIRLEGDNSRLTKESNPSGSANSRASTNFTILR